MAFPLNPTIGSTYAANGRLWTFNGYAWDSAGLFGPQGVQGPSGSVGPIGPQGPTGPVSSFNGLTGDIIFNEYVASLGGLTGHISFSQINIDGGTY